MKHLDILEKIVKDKFKMAIKSNKNKSFSYFLVGASGKNIKLIGSNYKAFRRFIHRKMKAINITHNKQYNGKKI